MESNKQVNKVLTKYIKSNKVLLAYSGGPDSTYLLESLIAFFKEKAKEKVVLAYVNYHDSKYTFKEENIVSYYTKKYHLTRYQLHVQFNKEKDHNFEEWARDVRYSFFKNICEIEKISFLIVGHHKDDLIETYILQKERKIIPATYGLSSLTSFKSYNVVRPLLSLYKSEIKTCLDNNNILYYDDVTNYYKKNTRYQIRNRNLSSIEKNKIVVQCKKENKNIEKIFSSFKTTKKDNYLFYQKLDNESKKRYIFYLLDLLPISINEKEGYLNLIYDYLKREDQGLLNLGSNYQLVKLKRTFFISKRYTSYNYTYTIEKPGIYNLGFFKIDLTKPRRFNIKKFPIIIRNNLPNDKISTNLISKDVHSFIKKQKVPIHLRKLYPVFLNEKKEIFLVPFYIDISKNKLPIYFY